MNCGGIVKRIIQAINNCLQKRTTQVAIVIVHIDNIQLMELINTGENSWEVNDYKIVQRQEGEKLFYLEGIYQLLHGYPELTMPVYLFIAPEQTEWKQLVFPSLSNKELRQAIAYELLEECDKKYYAYQIVSGEQGQQVTVGLVEQHMIDEWEQLIREEHQELVTIGLLTEAFDSETEELNASISNREVLSEVVVPEEQCSVIAALNAFGSQTIMSVLPEYRQASRYRWRLIGGSAVSVLLAITIGMGAYMGTSWHKQQLLVDNYREEWQLAEPEYTKLQQLRKLEQHLQQQQSQVQKLHTNTGKFYPLVVLLSANVVNGVSLSEVTLNESVVTIKGVATDYQQLNQYLSKLHQVGEKYNFQLSNSQVKGLSASKLIFTIKGKELTT